MTSPQEGSDETLDALGTAVDEAMRESRDAALLRIAAGRLVACKDYPYMEVALLSLTLVEDDELPGARFVGDAAGRVYANVLAAGSRDVREVATDWLHVTSHLLLDHAERFRMRYDSAALAPTWTFAGDCAIDQQLRLSGHLVPGEGVWPVPGDVPGANDEMSTEDLYALLRDLKKDEPQDGGQDGGPGGGPGGGGQEDGQEDGQGDGQGGGAGGRWTSECGSVGDGLPRPWDLPVEDGGLTPDQVEGIRDQVARAIQERARGIGDVPAGLARWASDHLQPVIDWTTQFRAFMRHSDARVAGDLDYTYQDLDRESMRRGLVNPAMCSPEPPTVVWVEDTSGSVSDEMLSRMHAETRGILRMLGRGGKDLKFVACDAAAGEVQSVRRVDQVRLTGLGGTDMRLGIAAALEAKPRPQVVIVATDGLTEWPAVPVPGVDLLVLLVRTAGAPAPPEVPWFMQSIEVWDT